MPFEDPLFNGGSGEFHGYRSSVYSFLILECVNYIPLKLNIPIHEVLKTKVVFERKL